MADGLRLALVGPQAPPAGGMARQFEQLCARLGEEGLKVSRVVVNAPIRPRFLRPVFGLRAAARLLPYVGALRRVAREVEVAHVMANSGWSWHLYAAPAVWAFHMEGVPVVVSYHGGLAEDFLRRQGRWVLPTLRCADALVVPSGFLEAVFSRHGLRPRVIPDTLDMGRFSPGTRAAGAHLVITRNLEAIYDIGTALKAFSHVVKSRPDARLSIAGSGALAEPLARQAHHLGIARQVRFCGRLSPEEIAILLADADVMLNPSLADNLPNSVLEALAARVPVVSTDVGGVGHLVRDEDSALLVKPGDEAAMAQAVLRLLSDGALRARLIDKGSMIAARHDWAAARPRWLSLYTELSGAARSVA